MEIYERNINSSVRKLNEKYIVTEASLLDLSHNMRVELKINLETSVIEEASAQILKAPFQVCNYTLENIKRIEGFKIERGINKKLINALGKSDGCTHFYELALEAVRLSFNVMLGIRFNWKEWVSRTVNEEEFIKMAMPYLKNSCLPFKTDE
ncbi:MAG: DUF2889 domain-containing protein [Acidobacteriota bacterium]